MTHIAPNFRDVCRVDKALGGLATEFIGPCDMTAR